jgi:hypothetical protein
MFCNSDSCDSAICRPELRSRPLVMGAFYFLYSPFPLCTEVHGSQPHNIQLALFLLYPISDSSLTGTLAPIVIRHMPSGTEKFPKIRHVADVGGPLRC